MVFLLLVRTVASRAGVRFLSVRIENTHHIIIDSFWYLAKTKKS